MNSGRSWYCWSVGNVKLSMEGATTWREREREREKERIEGGGGGGGLREIQQVRNIDRHIEREEGRERERENCTIFRYIS